MQRLKYNQAIVLKLLNLLNYVTFIKTSCQFCSLFPSLTLILFITKRRDKLQMCAPLQTKIGLFTFYSPFIVNLSLLSFSCFFSPRLLLLLFHLGVKSTSVKNMPVIHFRHTLASSLRFTSIYCPSCPIVCNF